MTNNITKYWVGRVIYALIVVVLIGHLHVLPVMAEGEMDDPLPSVPSNLRVTSVDTDSLTWQWNSSEGATGYKVYDGDTGNVISGIYPTTITYWTINNLSANQYKSIMVAGCNSSGCGEKTSAVGKYTYAHPPVNLSRGVYKSSSRTIKWSWNENNNSVGTKFRIELLSADTCNGEGSYSIEKSAETTETNHEFSLPRCKEFYKARVRAINGDNVLTDSIESPDKDVSVGVCQSSDPDNVNIGNVGTPANPSVKITWTETEQDMGAPVEFRIRRYLGSYPHGQYELPDRTFTLGFITGDTLSWNDSTAGNNTEYHYCVQSRYDSTIVGGVVWRGQACSGDGGDVITPIQDVTSVTCSNQTASGMTVTVTSPLTNLSEESSGVKLTDFSPDLVAGYMFTPTYQQSTSFDVGGLEENKIYSFKFKTKNQDGLENSETDWITDSSCNTGDDDKIAPVVNSLSATSPVCSGDSTTISWSASDTGGSGLNRVEVWYQTPAGWSKVSAGNCSGNKSASGSCTITPSSESYIYGIHAVDGTGNCITEAGSHCGGVTADNLDTRASKGPDTVSINYAPSAPSNLTFSNVGQNSADLSWNDNSNNETGFYIYRQDSLVHTNSSNDVTWTNTGLDCNQTYRYAVQAYNTCGESSATSDSATTDSCPACTDSSDCGAGCSTSQCASNNGQTYLQIRDADQICLDGSCICPAWSAYQACEDSFNACSVECYDASNHCNIGANGNTPCTCATNYEPDGSGGCDYVDPNNPPGGGDNNNPNEPTNLQQFDDAATIK